MTTTAWIITISYAVVVVIGSLIAVAVWGSTRRRIDATGEDVAAYSHREGIWLAVVVAALFVLLMSTIFFIPFGASAGANGQIVRVTGVQFAWAVTPATVRADVPVEFVTTTRDVTHGFGVYDEGGTLQFQVQVIPDRVQKVVHTFSRPGTYEVLCLEFCGKDHQKMVTTFEVVP